MTTDLLTRFNNYLAKYGDGSDEESAINAGVVGEFMTERFLDHRGMSWIKTAQSQDVYSHILRDSGVARPDYLVRFENENFFLDAKYLSRTTDMPDRVGFSLRKYQLDRLRAAQQHFGLELLLLVWDRSSEMFLYVITDLDRFDMPRRIGTDPGLEAFFEPRELSPHQF